MLNGFTFTLRHATRKFVTVCAGLIEWNERLNIVNEQGLLLEQKSCNVMCSGSNPFFIFKKVHVASTYDLSSAQTGVSNSF